MGNAHNKFGKDWTCTSKNMITGRQTHRHAHHNTLLPYRQCSNDAPYNLKILLS